MNASHQHARASSRGPTYRVGLVGAVIAMAIIACEPAPPKGPNAFARRAAFDFDCPVEELSYVPIKKSTPRTYGATGCHKRATYSEVCGGPYQQCQWVMDGPLQVEADAPAPAPSTSGSTSPVGAPPF